MAERRPRIVPPAWLAAPLVALLLGGLLSLPMAMAAGAAASPAWVRLEGRPVLELRSVAGAQQPDDVARRASLTLQQLADDRRIDPERFVLREQPPYTMLGLSEPGGGFRALLAVDDRAAAAFGMARTALAERYRDQLRGAIRQYRSSHSLSAWLHGSAVALLLLGFYALCLRLLATANRRLATWLAPGAPQRLGGIQVGRIQLLDSHHLRELLQILRRLGNAALLLLVSYLMLPLLLSQFPPTAIIGEGLRGHLRHAAGRLLDGTIGAIPNLLVVALILALALLAIRASNAWFAAIARGRLQIPGFYPEWAHPTRRLVAGALLLLGLVAAYPYVPGSGSRTFQGAGLFVGVLAALGSSAVATNVISGLMLIYTRAFREGDRVEINGVVGVVRESALLVTRIETPRHEVVSFPNASVIAAAITNFSLPAREGLGPVAVAATITIGYDVPWRRVHALLLAAAAGVDGLADHPPPQVLQTALNDFHISYELDACVRDVGRYRETLSELLAAIQDQFGAAGVEILSPGYQALRDGSASTSTDLTLEL
jgi:small-conductance mechanosensitive channel